MLTSNTNSQSSLRVLLVLAVSGTAAASLLLYFVLVKIETNTAAQFVNLYASNAKNLELEEELDGTAASNKSVTDDVDSSMNNAYASIEGHSGGTKSPKNNNSTRVRISGTRKFVLVCLTAILVLLNYLLLVVSNANAFLTALGLALVSFLALHAQILDELHRQRYDRLAAVVTCLLLIASALNLATYAVQQVAEEDLYQGPARIVGYDTSRYQATQAAADVATTTTRTDLEVAWGAAWACPNQPSQECRATVNGAVCEMDGVNVADDDYTASQGQDSQTTETEEVYYNALGEKITDLSEAEEVYDSNGNKVESWQYDTSATVDETTGKVETNEEDCQDETYYKNGTVKEDYIYQDETSQNQETGGQQDVSWEEDINYDGAGNYKQYDYTVDETDTNAAGKQTDEVYYYGDYNKDKDGTSDSTYVDGEVQYDSNGNVASETAEAEVTEKDANGETTEEDLDENVTYDATTGQESYNITEEDIVYDANNNVIEDSKEEMDSNGDGTYTTTSSSNGDGNGDGGDRRVLRRRRRHLEDSESQLDEQLQEEEAENEELKEENAELEKENEELQDELDEMEGEVEDEEEELEDEEEEIDEYADYDMDWGSIWGDYQCYQMFDTNLKDAKYYDASTPPGADDWPYLNVYGNCRTCEAYIVDYYSTEHFLATRSYKVASRNYGMAACVSLLLTMALALKQYLSPKNDNEIDLLEGQASSPRPAATVRSGSFA